MYVIISIYGRDEEYIRTIPARIFRIPDTQYKFHLLSRNFDDGLLRIRVQLGQDKCIWRVGSMDEDVMECFFRGRLFPNFRAPYGRSMILFIVEKLNNSLAQYNANFSDSTLLSRIPQVRL